MLVRTTVERWEILSGEGGRESRGLGWCPTERTPRAVANYNAQKHNIMECDECCLGKCRVEREQFVSPETSRLYRLPNIATRAREATFCLVTPGSRRSHRF